MRCINLSAINANKMKVVADGRLQWSTTAERHFPAQAIAGYASAQDAEVKPGIQGAKSGAEHYLRGSVAMQGNGDGAKLPMVAHR